MTAEFPEALQCLFRPARYKVLHGGRGGAKSWSVARALLLTGAAQPLRILCTREIQRSMRDSVHRLLSDQVRALGMETFYTVLDTEIRGKNGTLFVFAGLSSQTVDSIKSYEGVDRVWCEEAHGISKRSWDVLTPTIRKPGSEIWLTLNPELETDETYQRFVVGPPEGAVVAQVNYDANPWFTPELDAERRAALARDPDGYEQIWLGKPQRVAAGAIYRHEVDAAYEGGRITAVPYDPLLAVHTVWDLGWNDAMAILLVQRGPMDVRVIDYIEDSNRTLDWYVGQIEGRPYRWGTDFIPHDGRARNFQTGKSTEELLQGMGRKVHVLPASGVEEGIKAARLLWPKVYFDRDKTARLVECLKRYRRRIHAHNGEPQAPEHDQHSHGADAFRYLGQAVELMRESASEHLHRFKSRDRRPLHARH